VDCEEAKAPGCGCDEAEEDDGATASGCAPDDDEEVEEEGGKLILVFPLLAGLSMCHLFSS
jgi:hypothetical protein